MCSLSNISVVRVKRRPVTEEGKAPLTRLAQDHFRTSCVGELIHCTIEAVLPGRWVGVIIVAEQQSLSFELPMGKVRLDQFACILMREV